MEMEIVVSEWKMKIHNKQQTIAGKYQVKLGTSVISESEFNDGYNATEIAIPPDILLEVQQMDSRIRQAIIDNFTK